MTCQRCKEAYANGKPANFASEPECAFKAEIFDSNNWHCQTMNALRERAEESAIYNDDQWAAILPVPSLLVGFRARVADFIILGWYKHRGLTEAAYMLDQDKIMPLTLQVAEQVLR